MPPGHAHDYFKINAPETWNIEHFLEENVTDFADNDQYSNAIKNWSKSLLLLAYPDGDESKSAEGAAAAAAAKLFKAFKEVMLLPTLNP